MCVVDIDHCDCDCHRMEGVYHMMPCCEYCWRCDGRIRLGGMDQHLAERHPEAVRGEAAWDETTRLLPHRES